MNLYICEICGDAYIGTELPSDCPFCGASKAFIKPAAEARPIVNDQAVISELSKQSLKETLDLEMKATAIYQCIAGQAKEYQIIKMFKRLAKIEMEHAMIAAKLLGISLPEGKDEPCFSDDMENFRHTILLEDHAVLMYKNFAAASGEPHLRKFFGALAQAEQGHADLVKKFLY